MYEIRKRFNGYPFAHRQWRHKGHCALVHGHNWDFEIIMESPKLDENGFVYDFGKFKWLKDWLTKQFDHTCLINQDDPQLAMFENLAKLFLMDLRVVPSCSSEGLAKYVHDFLVDYVKEAQRRNWDGYKDLRVVGVIVYEDYKNSASYIPSNFKVVDLDEEEDYVGKKRPWPAGPAEVVDER
jgi:6-pyruvoyltetrahydropterin/6-carboxytetrahydropterin synthase